MNARRLLITLALCLGLAPLVHAQSLGRVEEQTANLSTYYVFTRPGDPTIQVSVLGAVRFPGIYVVSEGTDLGLLLDLSGGGAMLPRVSGRRRTIQVQLLRNTGSRREVMYEAPFEEMIRDTGSYPVLADGDALFIDIEERQRFSWRDGITVITALAAVTLAVDRLVR